MIVSPNFFIWLSLMTLIYTSKSLPTFLLILLYFRWITSNFQAIQRSNNYQSHSCRLLTKYKETLI